MSYALFLDSKDTTGVQLSSDLEYLLAKIYCYNKHYKKTIQCTELLKMKNLGSPATIHKNLILLVNHKLLAQVPDTVDKRIKFLEVTHHGKNYFTVMERLLKDCISPDHKRKR